MTPFAQLEKRAAATAARKPFHNPFQADDAQAVTRTGAPSAPAAPTGMSGIEKADLAMMGVSMIPVVGGIANGLWQVGRGAYNASQGNWGAAAGNLGWAAAGLIPGLGAGAKGVGLAAKGIKAAQGMNAATRVGRVANTVGNAAQRAGTAINAVGAKGVMHAGGKRIGSAQPWRGFNTPQITGGKLALGTGAMAVPMAAEAALPNYGQQATEAAATQAATPMFNPNQSFNHYLASVTAGGQQ